MTKDNYFYTTEESDVKKVLNFLEEHKIKYKVAIFSEAENVLGFTKLHVIQVYLKVADADKYLEDLIYLGSLLQPLDFH